MSAVVVLEPDRGPLRNELDSLVPDSWWHTTDELRKVGGRDQARELLRLFRVPDETCVIVEKTRVDSTDSEGLHAREAVLRRLLTDLVCSAYRQKMLHQQGDLFEEIEDLTHLIELP